ncbi:Alpha/Beta hydrolase protein [Rhexocercosporidium sp. MPI-PUGE-AT-0058]|nr:Alpha/Beta hydrolase protein [Rhexocercosporidium sp. MPI-PUGE-AT-0058]
MTDRHKLLFRKSAPSPHPVDLPHHITRFYIPTPLGTLELLAAEPATSPDHAPRKKSILFQHGGFGSASVFIPFLTYFSQGQHPCYALSLRGHGASWTPSFLRMVWGYPKSAFASDLQAGLRFVQELEAEKRGKSVSEVAEDIVLVGHSAGGGLIQYLLGEGMGTVGACVIMAGFPNFGGWGVYWNWFKMDPWFVPRYYLRDFWHPRSPLSSTSLVHQAFFSPSYPVSEVRRFATLMPEYESMLWPLSMMFRFVDVGRVVRSITGWGKGGMRLLVIAGEKDRLMDVELMRQMAAEYRVAVESQPGELGDGAGLAGEEQVGFEVVMGSGHHLQNDLYWEDCAGKILTLMEQL